MLIQGFLRSIVIQVFFDENHFFTYRIIQIVLVMLLATAFAYDLQHQLYRHSSRWSATQRGVEKNVSKEEIGPILSGPSIALRFYILAEKNE